MNPTVELVSNHKKANMRKSEFLMLEALKSAPHLNDLGSSGAPPPAVKEPRSVSAV